MQLTAVSTFKARTGADLVVIPFWETKKRAVSAYPGREMAPFTAHPIDTGDFCGKEGETAVVYTSRQKEKRVLLLGLGKEETVDKEVLRRAFSAAAKSARRKKCKTLNIALPQIKHLDPSSVAQSVCEGVLLGSYSFDALKREVLKDQPHEKLSKICLIGVGKEGLASCKETVKVVAAVDFARDLVNGNADDVTPQRLSQVAREISKEYSAVKATIFDKKKIEQEKMGLLLAVSRGAARDPAFIVLHYQGDPSSKKTTALIGKGITYDTGGLNLKPTGSMETMKCDMAGAAAVLGTIRAAAALGLKCNLIGAIATTENAIGPDSYKPGDVYVAHSGKTVEISNTDAEGRLVLADAISYVQKEYAPSQIIDLATLTGGIVIALGEEITGLFSNNDTLAQALVSAGERTGERVWRMPLYLPYKEALKSSVADIKNSADRKASSMTAAIFLHEFIKKTAWAHLDIAGTAFLSNPKHYNPSQATGVGVRLLIDFLNDL